MSETPNDSEAEMALKLAMEHIPQGLAVFDAAGTLRAANARYVALLALPAHLTARGTSLNDIVDYLCLHCDVGPEVHAAKSMEQTGAVDARAWQYRDANGRTLEFHARRMPDGGLTVSLIDISAQVAAEAELARLNLSLEGRVNERTATLIRVNSELEIARAKADAANLDKTRFLAAASHDLLQPLNAARLYTANLIETVGGADGRVGELARGIEGSLNAVEEIMSALLDISRIDSGVLKPAPRAFSMRELLEKIEVEFGPLAREKSIALNLVGSDVGVMADRALVARIVQNLVSNAIKYTRPGGRVLVGCRLRGARVRLDIVDTGVGFNKDQHALIFAEFSRLEQGARMAHGLGLGLSIVQRLVGVMGAGFELDSVEGRGSRFSLFLTRSRAKVTSELGQQPTLNFDLSGLKILCLDNDRAIVEAMSGLLGGWGCEVRGAESLKEISHEKTLEGWLPDLVLVDYHLNQTSGLDAIEWLKHNIGGHLSAALITADRSPAVRLLAEERGVVVVTKPVKPAALRAVIGNLAGARPPHPVQAGSRPGDSNASN